MPMKPSHAAALALALVIGTTPADGLADTIPVLVIHGGAGTLSREDMTAEREEAFRTALQAALDAGFEILDGGGAAMDAVIESIALMEDDPLFNAGRGAVFTHEGRNEMDAAVMDGATRDAGAVAGVRLVRNPVRLAREVMTASPHVMLSGAGAEEFARARELEMRPPEYFRVDRRWRQLQRALEGEARARDDVDLIGTVGAVALDRFGNLAAGTSTGGMTNKRWGRVGDSPIIGAGTYASNDSCAVSATGHGEYFIRAVVAHDICARVRYEELSVADAAQSVILGELPRLGGAGGVIVLGPDGDFAMVFNTSGMYRGVRIGDGRGRVAIFADED
jgi:beta-aspartyl-peptidase (threonine type)